jgi:hypothetical protein
VMMAFGCVGGGVVQRTTEKFLASDMSRPGTKLLPERSLGQAGHQQAQLRKSHT